MSTYFEAPRTPRWLDDAPCSQVDPDLWHPSKGESTKEAKRICNGYPKAGIDPCPVREQCLEWALSFEIDRDGIFGGLSERERRVIRQQRRAAA